VAAEGTLRTHNKPSTLLKEEHKSIRQSVFRALSTAKGSGETLAEAGTIW
jgi:hypothetical protein